MDVEGLIMDNIKKKQLVSYGYVQTMKENRRETNNGMGTCGKTKKKETQNNMGNANTESNK